MSRQPPPSLSPLPRRWIVLPGSPSARRPPYRLEWRDLSAGGTGVSDGACRRVEAHLKRRRLVREDGPQARLLLAVGAGLAADACRLGIDARGARLSAGGEAGFHRGVEVLACLAEAGATPCLEIEDGPRHAWRGLMLDCARHFWPTSVLERVLDEAARHGVNRLHLHLTDDQGWRLPLPGRPELERAAWRRERDGSTHGGLYSADELRDLVELGRQLGVEILPEIDLPGHCGALLAALPGLSCDGTPREVPRAWGCHHHVLCLGRPETLEFLEEVLDGLAALFPFPVVHLGGDEVSPASWAACPRCRELARREGLEPAGLATWWLRRLAPRLKAAGRRGAFWDEAVEAGAPADALIFAWRGRVATQRSLAAGHETVACPQRPCYLDHYPDRVPGQARAIGGWNAWSMLRNFDPAAGLHGGAHRVIGGQGNLWTEYVDSVELLMERLQPRLAALCEALWSGAEIAREGSCFLHRLPDILLGQHGRGWPARVDSPDVEGIPLAEPGGEIRLSLRATLPGARLEARLEGDRPGIAMSPAQHEGELRLSLSSPAADSRLLQVRQTLSRDVASPWRPLRLRWEPRLAARRGEGRAGGPRVACCWLSAPGADWARVQVEPGSVPWWRDDFDWPEDAVSRRLATAREHPGVEPSPEDMVAPPPAGVGLRRESLLRAIPGGPWTFRITARSPARLWLDEVLVVDHDGFAPGGAAEGVTGLAAGRHRLRLDWLDLRGGGCRLELCDPRDRLFRPPTGRLSRPADHSA